MLTTHSVKIQSVSELTRSIRGLLESQFPFVTVTGEISNLRNPHSGHLYFILKDHDAQLRAVLFKQQQRYLDIKPENGLQVICRGRISVYEQRGEYQLLIDSLESQGAGQLQIAFEQLKSTLAREGLFEQAVKKPLPFLPEKVSLITSPEGAAVHDFLRMAENRYPGLPIEIIPVRVQGDSAAAEISEALAFLNRRQDTDVIVLCRGGGSLEDLWAFNEEKLARAIYASEIPVVSAIGHEIDFTISDFVADYRAATPSAAAEVVIPDKKTLRQRIGRAESALSAGLTRITDRYRFRVDSRKRRLGDPSLLLTNFVLKLRNMTSNLTISLETRLNDQRRTLNRHAERLREAGPDRVLKLKERRISELCRLTRLFISGRIDKERDSLGKAAALLDAVSPLAVLGRGYAIIIGGAERKAIRDSHELTVGEGVEVVLDNGGFEAEVTAIKHRND
ncbi:MAG: exodeoxyribonuclease VII large subunit [Desulfurivibrionaceae bacterium]|nr:exodeoxyribonuclease VII large subunit [Desulfurivibrionaceae bacterium]